MHENTICIAERKKESERNEYKVFIRLESKKKSMKVIHAHIHIFVLNRIAFISSSNFAIVLKFSLMMDVLPAEIANYIQLYRVLLM